MTPLRAIATALALVSGSAVFSAGCSGSSTACVPGQSVSCAGNVQCANAFQVCKEDGSSYGECQCAGPDAGPTTFPPVGANSGLIGAACQTADNCRRGLECVPSSAQVLHGEGPAGGLCLARCVPGHDFCNGFDANAKCRVLDDGGTPNDPSDDLAYCLPGCKIGDTKDPDKCRNRRDVVCSENPAGSGAGFCIPMCSSDIDCKPRVCDIRTGLCGDVSPTGDAIGSVCSVDNDTCAGACLPGLNFPQCSAPCSYGEPGACGQNRTTPPYDYFCAIDAALGSGPGDLGYCSRACLCDDDCARADAVCEPDPSLVAKTGRSGICGSKLLPSGVARKNLPCK